MARPRPCLSPAEGCGLLPGLQAATSPGYGGRDQHFVPCAGALTAHDPSLLALPIAIPSSEAIAPNAVSSARRNVYMSWNKGTSIFPSNCLYRHVCTTCQLLHKELYFKRQRSTTAGQLIVSPRYRTYVFVFGCIINASMHAQLSYSSPSVCQLPLWLPQCLTVACKLGTKGIKIVFRRLLIHEFC